MATLIITNPGIGRSFEVSGVTTLKYAAKRVAADCGLDDALPWYFVVGSRVLPDDELASEHDGERMQLARPRH